MSSLIVGCSSKKDIVATENRITNYCDKMVNSAIEAIKYGPLYPTKTLFDALPVANKHVYNQPTLRPFELASTLVVHAAMKMGKTKALVDLLATHFSSKLKPPVIRFVSFRQTFSGNIKEKFKDFTLYSDVKGALNQAKLIVQVESLHRLEIGIEPPDLLILDECESIFEQFDSGLLKGNFNDCFAKFQYLLKYSKHVVCMDAMISDRCFRVLDQIRPGFKAGVCYHHNCCRNAQKDRYVICGNKNKWYATLYAAIDKRERVAIPTSSLEVAKVLEIIIKTKYPNIQVKLYSSDTSAAEKREHFADVNIYWRQLDALIYTPTVSAGVSFEEKHFAKVFGYFSDKSCPVETCIQMIGRIRDVASSTFYICLNATGNNLPCTVEEIQRLLLLKRSNLFKNFDDSGLHIEYDYDGKMILHAGDYLQIWLENTRMRNLSRNSFIKRFIHTVSLTGATFEFMSDAIFEDITGFPVNGEEMRAIIEQHAVCRKEIAVVECKNISSGRELEDYEVEKIRANMIAQIDISQDEKCAFDKHRLRADYNYSGVIDEKFVAKYREAKTKRIFRNLTRVASHSTIEGVWAQIRAEESANHKFLMDQGEIGSQNDLNRRYLYDQHRFAMGFVKLAGFNHINDPQYIHRVVLQLNFRNGEKKYWNNITAACTEFSIRAPSLRKISQLPELSRAICMLEPINKILGIMYGVSIMSKPSDPDMFYVSPNNMFTLDPVVSIAKRMPLIIPITLTNVGFSDEMRINDSKINQPDCKIGCNKLNVPLIDFIDELLI